MSRAEPSATAEAVRVVIAEDESIIRLDLKETLAEEGYEVVGDTGRGDDAVDLVARLAPDVAILDIKMPGLDGLAAARRIADLGTTAVVILTAFSQRELVAEAASAGALAYLVKPFQRHEIVPAVEIALARHRQLRGVTAEAARLEDQLAARKAIDRAKGVLMDRHGMSEHDAFVFIQHEAMSHRRTMTAVAHDVVEGRLEPSGVLPPG